MTAAALGAMLQAAVTLLLFVQTHPELPDSARVAAIQNATTAIAKVSAELPKLKAAQSNDSVVKASAGWVAPLSPQIRMWIRTSTASLPKNYANTGYEKTLQDNAVTFTEGDSRAVDAVIFVPKEGLELGCCDFVYRIYKQDGTLVREVVAAPPNPDRTKKVFIPGTQQFDRRISMFDFEQSNSLPPGTYKLVGSIDRLSISETLTFTITPRTGSANAAGPLVDFTASAESVYESGVVELALKASNAMWCEISDDVSSTSKRVAFEGYFYEQPTKTTTYSVYCAGYSVGGAATSNGKKITVTVKKDSTSTPKPASYRLTSNTGVQEWAGLATQYETAQRCKVVFLKSVRAGVTPTGKCTWDGIDLPLSQIPTW